MSFIIVLFSNSLFAQHSLYMPVPPPNVDRGVIAQKPPLGATVDVVINNVPSYTWTHGCGPTALGMVIGYFDGLGFSDLVSGSASTQTTGVNDVIANSFHYNDYSLPIDNYPTLLTDKSQTGGAHSSNCLADFMKTSWSIEGNYYGWSWSNYIAISYNSYISFINSAYQHQASQIYYSDVVAWNTFINEIDNNRPVVLLVDSDGDGGTDHFVTGIGYNSSNKTYAIYDTWDHNIHWYTWHAMSSGNAWGIWGFTTFILKFNISASVSPSGNGSVSGAGYFYAGEQISLTANAYVGFNFVNWTENGIEVSTSTTYQFTANSNRILVANFEQAPPVVPESYSLSNKTLLDGTSNCFNALQTITVAGGETTVDFENGSTVDLIAGQSITFLPGFHSHSGSLMNAWITTDGSFCDPAPAPIIAQQMDKSSFVDGQSQPDSVQESGHLVKLYPNPNNGLFTIELNDCDNATITIFNLAGTMVFQQKGFQSGKHLLQVRDIKKGVYILNVNETDKQIIRKFVVE